MHTYIYATLLASNYQKSADVTRYVTFRLSKRSLPRCQVYLFKALVSSKQIHTPLFTTLYTVKTCQNLQMVIAGSWLSVMMKFLTANEVCEWLRLSRKGLWELERAGKLIPDRIGSRLRYREHEIIQFLDDARALRGHAQQANSHSKKNFPSQVQPSDVELGTGISEAELANAENGSSHESTNPISERSIYTYLYAHSESTSVADIDAQFREDLKTLDIDDQNKFLPLGSAV